MDNIEKSIPLFIDELRSVVQSDFNMCSGHFIEEDILVTQKLLNKLRSIDIINEKDISFILKNTNELYFSYTKDTERQMMTRTPGIQAAWKNMFIKKSD